MFSRILITLLFALFAATGWLFATFFLIDELFSIVREITGLPTVLNGKPVPHYHWIGTTRGYGEIFAAVVLVSGAAPAVLIALTVHVWHRTKTWHSEPPQHLS